MNRYTVCLLVLAALAAPLLAGPKADQEPDFEAIYRNIDRVLVTVEYRAEMTFMGQSEDIEGRVPGISVKPEGTVIFDGTSLGYGSYFGADAFSAPRVEKPKSIKITDAEGNTYDADFIGVDNYSSIAFCRLPDSVRGKIPVAEFKDVDLRLGQDVFMFWMLPESYEPRFQMARTVITNILEKPEKYYLTGELTVDFMMSPIVTTGGDLVGVVTPLSETTNRFSPFDLGTTFGTPVGIMPHDQFQKLLAKPPAPDQFKRGWLGIALQALDPEIAEFWNITTPGGIIVSDVINGSPAAECGLKTGDFIVGLDNRPLEIQDDAALTVFQKMISELGAGGEVNFTVIRPGDGRVDTLVLACVLDETPTAAGEAPSYEDENFDLTVRDLVFADYNSRNLDPDEIKGIMIDKLEPGGWAAVGGVNPGDIIMRINDRNIESVEDYKTVIAEVEKSKDREIVVKIWRANKTQFVNIKTHWK